MMVENILGFRVSTWDGKGVDKQNRAPRGSTLPLHSGLGFKRTSSNGLCVGEGEDWGRYVDFDRQSSQ